MSEMTSVNTSDINVNVANMPQMEAIAGYDSVSDTAQSSPPIIEIAAPEILQFNISSDVKAKTQDQSRARLIKHCEDECCWGTKPAKECVIDTCVGLSSFHCMVQTYVETRTTGRAMKPYHNGDHYTSPSQGSAPQPWQIQCVVQPFWKEEVERIEVPYTSTIHKCHVCGGDGKVRCTSCGGDGQVRCNSCGGDGKKEVRHTTGEGKNRKTHTTQERCKSCGGDGKVKDTRCGGTGQVTCSTCTGTGRLRHFILMTRTHTTLKHERAVDTIPDADLSPKDIGAAPGKMIVEKSSVNIAAPKGFNEDVDKALVDVDVEADVQVKSMRALQHQQKIALKMVPVTFVKAHVGDDKEGKFRWYIYGTDDRIQACDYPATMCCGCEIV